MINFIQLIIIIAGSLVSEDATLFFASSLLNTGFIPPYVYWIGGFVGILAGDIILYYIGCCIAKGRGSLFGFSLNKFKNIPLKRSKSFFIFLMATQVMPGSRLATYVGAGIAKYPPYLFILAKALVLPLWLWVFLSLDEWIIDYLRASVWVFIAILLLMFLIYRKISHSNKRYNIPLRIKFLSFLHGLKKWLYYEFWPAWLFYIPEVFFIIYFAIKYKFKVTLLTASNPSLTHGGLIGEPKSEAYDLLPSNHDSLLKYRIVDIDNYQYHIKDLKLKYPVILKPDKGQRGVGVVLIRNQDEAIDYLQSADFIVILQEYCDYKYEAGIFYIVPHNNKNSQIFSITDKIFPVIKGDGKHSIAELILKNKRARIISSVYFSRFKNKLNSILTKGEDLRLVESGNHCQGAIFLDGMDKIYTTDLHKSFDEISKSMNNFYIGRFDVRYRNINEFKRGKGFKIIEVNGAASEATHIYDPKISIFQGI